MVVEYIREIQSSMFHYINSLYMFVHFLIYHTYLSIHPFIQPSIYSSIFPLIGRAQCSIAILNWSTKCFYPSSMVFQNIEIFQGLFSLTFGYNLFLYSSFTSVLFTRGTGRKIETCIVIGYRFSSILKLTHTIM